MLQSVRQYVQHQVQKQWRPLALSLLCLLTVLPGMFLSFEDSEIWGITSSRRFIDDIGSFNSSHFKPLFSAIFGTIVHLAPTDWSALVASRWVALAFTAGGLFSLYFIALHQLEERRSRVLTILTFILFTTVPLFLVHFPKVRSDSIASSVVLIGLFFLTNLPKSASLIYFLTSVLALLITPKSIDLVAAMGLFYWASGHQPSLRKVLWLAGPSTAVLALGLFLGRESMARVVLYWFDSYQSNEFLGSQSWSHIWISITSAPITFSLLLIGLLVGVANFKSFSTREKCLIGGGTIVLLFILVHSQKFHFFLASRLPFLALAALPGVHRIADYLLVHWKISEVRLRLVLLAVVSVSLAYTVLRLDSLSTYQMQAQRISHEELRQFLLRAGRASFWDGIGLFPKMNSIFHYPSPGDRENATLLEYAEMSKPVLVIRTSKMELLDPALHSWLTSHYASLSPSVSTRISVVDRVFFSGNCGVSRDVLEKLKIENRLTGEIILLAQTNSNWIQIPFSTNRKTIHARLNEIDSADTAIFNGCFDKNTRFALASEKPWQAVPAPADLFLFSYDGRL